MDKSETNIKMCEKAEKIQALRPHSKYPYYEDGDMLYAHWPDGTSYPVERRERRVGIYSCLGNNPNQYSKSIWLPYQDQLQEMVSANMQLLCGKIFEFSKTPYGYGFCTGYGGSMEQLWLAFVMKEKYNKTWDGENWIERG